ncbi:exo-alpha-sialidase [Corynebacterium sp. CCM 9204]|uniref:exo-alpha-sialidase n=1 Tax=Corynebacterium sp. CCM 9204 TaxID=3057616 RepID=UPI00352334AC
MIVLKRRKAMVGAISTLTLIGGMLASSGTPGAYAGERLSGSAGFDANDELTGQAFFTDEVIATGGEEGYDCYRIPSLGVAPDGTVLASWDGRPGSCADAPQANSIVLRKSSDSGESWTPQEVIAQGDSGAPRYGFSDPSIVVDYQTGDIFNFHVKSFDRGIRDSQLGTDPDDRDVLHAAFARSSDNGATWDPDHVITRAVTRENPWRGRFATSGNGIQLQYGRYAGRLVQPAMVVTSSGEFRAVTWLSDDHGETWFAGRAWGTGMDENKIVELSDGTLMNNSRRSGAGESARKISYSHDGGVTWTEPYYDPALPDPRNNASLIRVFPNAPEGSAKAKVLLFSNTASSSGRENGTVRMSCDDGQTWPVSRLFRSDNLQYTSMSTLPDGNIGLLFEEHNRGINNNIHFAKFNLEWLGAACMDLQSSSRPEVRPGETVTVAGTLTNNFGGDIVDRGIQLDLPEGWTAVADAVTVADGATVPVAFEITAPADAPSGTVQGLMRIDDGGTVRQASFKVDVIDGYIPEPGDVSIVASVTNPGDFGEGDRIHYNFRVSNPNSTPVGILPDGELELFDPDTSPRKNCRWNTFNGNTEASCSFPFHTVTAEDIERGYYEPTVTWRIGRPGHGGEAYKTITMTLPRVTFGENGDDATDPVVIHADLNLEPIAPVQSRGVQHDLEALVTVNMREDGTPIPDDARVILYVDNNRVGDAEVMDDGTAAIPFTVANIASGLDAETHTLRARLIATPPQGFLVRGSDAIGEVTVLPEDRPVTERTLTLGQHPDINSDGKPRSIPLAARVSGPDGAVRGATVTFSIDGEPVAEAISNTEGLAVVRYTVESIPAGGQVRTVTVVASVPESSDDATDYAAATDETTFNVLPVSQPESPEVTTSSGASTIIGAPGDDVLSSGGIVGIGAVLAAVAGIMGLLGFLPWFHHFTDLGWWVRPPHI